MTDDQAPSGDASRLWKAAAGIALGGLAAYALAVEPYWLEVTHVPLFCPRLPDALDGVSLLLLADFHVAQWGRRERMLAELLDELPTPDITVVAGDLIHGARGIEHAVRLIENHVRARHARFVILGNAEHKLRFRRRRRMVRCLEEIGLTVLINRHETLRLRDTEITVAGTDDPYYGHADLDATLADRPADRFCLLLAHSPQVAVAAARAGVDVIVSGHTHGGQVRLPFFGPILTHNPLGRRVDAGYFDRARLARALGRDPGGDAVLYISRGIGAARLTRRIPLYPRFLCRPEVAWLTLRAVSTPEPGAAAAESDRR